MVAARVGGGFHMEPPVPSADDLYCPGLAPRHERHLLRAVQTVLSTHGLSSLIAAWLPLRDLATVASLCSDVLLDEHFWRQCCMRDYRVEQRYQASWLETIKDAAASRFAAPICEVGAAGLRMLVVGDVGVGKAAYVERLTGNLASMKELSKKSVIEVDFAFRSVRVAATDIRLLVCPVASPAYFRGGWRGARVCMVCYDVTNRASFERCRGLWLPLLAAQAARGCVIGLVACKCDLTDKRQVSCDEGAALAEQGTRWLGSRVVHFTETSSQTGAGVEASAARCLRSALLLSDVRTDPLEAPGCCGAGSSGADVCSPTMPACCPASGCSVM